MKFNEKDILILDIETGGLEKEKCGITQITMMKFGNSEIFFNEYLKPCPNFEYKKEALEKQKISIEFLEKKGKEPIEVFRNMFSWIEKNFCNKPIFAGQNILAFDLPYLDYHINEFMRPMNFSNIGHYKKIDLLLVTPLLDRFRRSCFSNYSNYYRFFYLLPF